MNMSEKREEEEKSLHDKAVAEIAKQRFPFPSDNHPNWRTYINEPESQVGVVSDSETYYPDIVVVDESKGKVDKGTVESTAVAMLGEVESESTVTQQESKQWKDYSELSNTFYLYVPKGLCDEAKRLASNIKVSGFREWQFDSKGNIHIEKC